jgi:caffeoyl-CoA O-methyltransferase
MSSNPSPWIDRAVYDYVEAHCPPVDPVLADLIEETKLTGQAIMQISPSQGFLMQMLVKLTNARNVVEVGTFTGFSSICIARALPEDGSLLCCDLNDAWTQIAEKYWRRDGIDHKIELRLGPAIETLRALPIDPHGSNAIDFAFIDADKPGYLSYYRELMLRMRTNGVLLVDNTLQQGDVTREAKPDMVNVLAIQAFNDHVAADPAVDSQILPIGDGLTLIRKR